MAVIQTLCSRGICLRSGGVVADGPITEVVQEYLKDLEQISKENVADRKDRKGLGRQKLTFVEVTDGRNPPSSLLKTGGPAKFVFEVSGWLANISCGFIILDDMGRPISVFKSDVPAPDDYAEDGERIRFVCEIEELMLVPGRYRVDVFIRGGGEQQDLMEGAVFFDVEVGILRGRSITAPLHQRASACMPHRWITPSQKY
jgi:lipopolysaccharide transport system ATP-binding protein